MSKKPKDKWYPKADLNTFAKGVSVSSGAQATDSAQGLELLIGKALATGLIRLQNMNHGL